MQIKVFVFFLSLLTCRCQCYHVKLLGFNLFKFLHCRSDLGFLFVSIYLYILKKKNKIKKIQCIGAE